MLFKVQSLTQTKIDHLLGSLKKDRLSALHPDMSDSMINMKILRKCGGELEYAIKCRCVEPCSTEEYINAMEDIISRTRISKPLIKKPMESKMIPKISREDKKPLLKCHKCGITSCLANAFVSLRGIFKYPKDRK
ncbi:hypothetical protein O181_119525 [Austropuccinia psidii MF-1]|uniref:Uncharacterized protein n=1 Tax=Austropuccinia psidii MF-1 TaxID=1389203 RepID=A0A9Q3KE78_9BASI|nr:hypothetical protein [Austropuccinia psidii MF-1]